MIRITVGTKEELDIVRRVLKDEACSHNSCERADCKECIAMYLVDKVQLYKKETVEMPQPFVI